MNLQLDNAFYILWNNETGKRAGDSILNIEEAIGIVFTKVLEDAGVYKRTEEGKAAFKRFIESL